MEEFYSKNSKCLALDYDDEFNYIAASYSDKTMRIVNLSTNKIELEIPSEFQIEIIKFDKTLHMLVCGTDTGLIRLYLWPFYGF